MFGEIEGGITDLQGLQQAGADIEVVAEFLAAFDGAIPAPVHVGCRAAGQAAPNATIVLDQRV